MIIWPSMLKLFNAGMCNYVDTYQQRGGREFFSAHLGEFRQSRNRAAPGSRLRTHPLRGLAAASPAHPFRFRPPGVPAGGRCAALSLRELGGFALFPAHLVLPIVCVSQTCCMLPACVRGRGWPGATPCKGKGSARVLTRSVLACGSAPRAASGRALAPSLFHAGTWHHRHASARQQINPSCYGKKNKGYLLETRLIEWRQI